MVSEIRAFVITSILTCSVNHDPNLCNSGESYSYTNYSARTETCGCAQQDLCVRKCCHNEFMEQLNASMCTESLSQRRVLLYEDEDTSYDKIDNYINGRFNCTSIEQSPPNFNLYNSITEEKCYVQENGTLYYPFSPHKFYNNSQYCVDKVKVYVCWTPTFDKDTLLSTFEMLNNLVVSGRIISLPFFVATLIVVTVTRKPSLHKKALILFVLTLSLRYIVEIGNEFYRYGDIPPRMCSIIGYSKIFLVYASFLWSNIIWWDIWFTFSGRRGFNRNIDSGSKNFLFCSLYVWGITTILTSMILLLDTYGDENASWYPGIGASECFIQNYLPKFIFYHVPIIILITVNFILFILTVHHIRKIAKEISSFDKIEFRVHSRHVNKPRYQLYLKLLFGTGINWGMELPSFITAWVYFDTDFDSWDIIMWLVYVEYIINMHDALYGVLFFLLFVFKEKHWQFLKKRCILLFKKGLDPATNA